jgi:hypothetical protein
LGILFVQLKYWKAHRTLKEARALITGTSENSFEELPSYLYRIRRANPGTLIKLEVDGNDRFKFLFLAFDASIRGFPFMRKVVVVDGTFLHGKYKGTLLTATMQDGNFNIFPMAFGVVDTENDESWEWFFRQLNRVIPDDQELVIISDRHRSIAKAIETVYPLAARGICTYHLRKNILSQFNGGESFKLFKKAATAYRLDEFNAIFEQIQILDQRLYEYLVRADIRMWSHAHFPGNRYNFTTTNIAESINHALAEARTFPIVQLIDAIRAMLTRWFAKRRAKAAATTTILTAATEKILNVCKRRLVVDLW